MEETVIKITNTNMVDCSSDDLEDFDLAEEKPAYQVWLLGRNEFNDVTDFEYQVDEFDSAAEAIKCAQFFSDKKSIQLIKNKDEEFFVPADVKTIDVVVETVVVCEDGSEENIDTIYEERVEL